MQQVKQAKNSQGSMCVRVPMGDGEALCSPVLEPEDISTA